MNPLHVVPQLLQVLDVTITDLTDDKVALASALASPRLAWLGCGGGGAPLGTRTSSPRQRGDGDGGGVTLAASLLAKTLGEG